MKQLIFLFMLYCFTTVQSQDITNINVSYGQEAVDASVDTSIYIVAEPSNGDDATIAQYNLDGTLLQQQVFPNDNPSFTTVQAKEVSANKGLVFAIAQTFSNVRGGLNRSESLFKMPSDLLVTSATDRLVAYNSEFSGLYNNDEFIYALYSASEESATLSINNVDGTGPSLIPNPGVGSRIATWLLKIDANDVTNVVQIVPIGNTDTVFINNNLVDSRFSLKQNLVELNNGNIVIEYTDSGSVYLQIHNPVDLSIVKNFGPFDQDVSIVDFNEGYVFAYFDDRELEFLDSNFVVQNRTWSWDLVLSPYKMQQFGEFLKVACTLGSPGTETTRMSYFGERLISSHKRGGVDSNINFENYAESFFLDRTTTINVVNHVGAAINFGGIDFPETEQGVENMIIYTTDESGPEDTIGITATNPDFDEVFQNTKLDPRNNDLISGTFNETWVTLSAGVEIPDDDAIVPAHWINDIQIPDGFRLVFGNFALMGTDPFSSDGYNRFFTVQIVPLRNQSFNQTSLIRGEIMRVWVTHNSFNTLSVDDFDTNDFSVYPNPTNGIVNIQNSAVFDLIEIYSMTGQQIGRYGAVSQIDLGSVPPGVYMLRISSFGGASTTMKIVKK